TALAWLSAQSGPAPSEMATGDMLGWNAMIHKSGAKRAKGGSGALTQAMAKRLLSDGGEIICDAEVAHIARDGSNWRVSYGGTTSRSSADAQERVPPDKDDRTVTASRVVSAIHLHTLFGKLLQDSPEELKKRALRTRIGNGFGMM